MNILISASMKVYPQLIDLKKRLEKLGYAVELPDEGSGETGSDFALGKPIYVLEEMDDSSDYAEDLRAIGVVELRGDLGVIKEVGL